jgi:PAS domain-containing protein
MALSGAVRQNHLNRMRKSCSRCRAALEQPPEPLAPERASDAAARGMCAACFAYFERIRQGLTLGEYLDMFRQPVLVSDADGNVLAANSVMASLTGREPAELRGIRFGGALSCERARLPGGCGKTTHCRDCTIRRMVTEVSRTRLARRRVPAYLQTEEGRHELCVTVRPGDGDVLEVILEDAPADTEA